MIGRWIVAAGLTFYFGGELNEQRKRYLQMLWKCATRL